MKQLRVLISGASIAGPATALLLLRQGHRVTIVERAPTLRGGGQTVDLRGAGRTVIERMGLAPATNARLLDQRGIAKVNGRGKRIASIPVEAFGGNGMVSTHEILRGDLADVLIETLDAEASGGVEYLWDDTVTTIDQGDEGVQVAFAGSPAREFDLVIGADGLNSAVRRAAFGPDSATRQPIGLRYAWFTAAIDQPLDGWYLMHNARGGRVVSARPSRNAGEVKAGLALRGSDATRRGREEQFRLFEDALGDLGWVTPQLLRAMRTAPDWAYNDLAQVKLESWTRGRVTLVGDAGYCPTPLTGLGTTLALVGAYVLAGEIERSGGDPAVALPRYDEVMRPFVRETQTLPPSGAAGYAPKGRIGVALVEASYRYMNRWPMRPLFEAQFAKSDGIELPGYGRAA